MYSSFPHTQEITKLIKKSPRHDGIVCLND